MLCLVSFISLRVVCCSRVGQVLAAACSCGSLSEASRASSGTDGIARTKRSHVSKRERARSETRSGIDEGFSHEVR